MSGHGPVVGLGRALGDHDHVAQLTLADVALDAGLGPAQGPAAAQARRELFAQGASALDEERWSMVSCDTDRSGRWDTPEPGSRTLLSDSVGGQQPGYAGLSPESGALRPR